MSSSLPTSTLEKFTNFGDFLRFLRRRAGITQLELSIAVGYSDAQISRLEQGFRLPDIHTIEARFVPALDLEDEPEAIARLLELAAQVRREDAPGLGICPYKGLNYFDESDAELFVGREALTAKLTERILTLASSRSTGKVRFLGIVGASGSGKSSLVRAGLGPSLRWNKISANWPIHIFTPSARPLESLAASLTQDSDSVLKAATLVDDLGRDHRSLNLFIKRSLNIMDGKHVLLVVDQFEELFALCHSEEERSSFIHNLLTAASESDGPGIAVITLRADFYAACAIYPQLREALAQQQEYIGAMNDEEMRRAIEEPASRGRWEFESGLADLLLHDVGQEPGALPLLSHALLETWQRRRGRTMTVSGYISSGGVQGAIAETAESVFADRFTADQQAIARRIFLRLTEPSDEIVVADTRRRARFEELILKPEEANETRVVLNALADARLIITSEDTVEVAHEALIREWPTLRGWLEDNREGLRLHRHLTEASQEWLLLDREPDILYRGARLARANEWAEANADELNALEREFLEVALERAELEAVEREEQHRRELEAARKLTEAEQLRAEEQALSAGLLRKRALYLAGALFISLILAGVALFIGVQARRATITAQNQERIAISRELAAAAINNLEIDPERSILLALQASTPSYTVDGKILPQVVDALHRGLQATRLRYTLPESGRGVFSPDGKLLATGSPIVGDTTGEAKIWDAASGNLLGILPGHADRAFHVVFSPNGDYLAVTSENGLIKIWDVAQGKVVVNLGSNADMATSPAFSPDGKRLAVNSSSGVVILWDVTRGEKLSTLQHPGIPVGIAFSPDGEWVATGAEDGSVKIWDTETGALVNSLEGHSDRVCDVIFSPEGAQLATVSYDGTAKIWDMASMSEVVTFFGHTGFVCGVDFSPDGTRIATGGEDGSARVWDAKTGQELILLVGHTQGIDNVAFSPDGTMLTTASADRTTRVWDVSPGGSRDWLTLVGHSDDIVGIAYSPEGDTLATVGMDGKGYLWNTQSGNVILTLAGNPGWAIPAFHPQRKLLVTGSDSTSAKIWDLEKGTELIALEGHKGPVTAATFSPDGYRLATANIDGTIKVWDVSGLSESPVRQAIELFTLSGHSDEVYDVAFSPLGEYLLSASRDATARLWNVVNGEQIRTFHSSPAPLVCAVFSPDGSSFVTGGMDGIATIWKTDTTDDPRFLLGHSGIIWEVAFSPDGKQIATASMDGKVKLWDMTSGDETLTLTGYTNFPTQVSYSPDGKFLATASADGTARIYVMGTMDLIALAKERVTRSLREDECKQYLHMDECP